MDRKPLAKIQETKEVYPIRLKPSEIQRAKDRALVKGIGHTTLAREWFLRGMKMDRLEELEQADTRITA